jgi:flagellar biosynthetic protein FlhB
MSGENDSGQDKTEEPTDKKKKDSRDEGQVAQSKDLASVGVLLSVVMGFVFFGPGMSEKMQTVTIQFLTAGADNPESFTADPTQLLAAGIYTVVDVVAPIMVVAMVMGFFLAVCQVGFHWSWKSLTPDIKRFDPIKGLKNKLFSAQAIAEWLKSMGKVIVVGLVSWNMMKKYAAGLVEVADYDLAGAVAWGSMVVGRLVGFVLLFMLILGIADYIFQFYQVRKKMMMTLKDIKDETKEQEGDPYLKAKVRAIMNDASRGRLVSDMAEATVVISNPTHYSVAVKYEVGQAGPPMIVARGLDNRAMLIKDIARSQGIPRVENRPLARALYAQCKVGDAIPGDLYEGVAEVLAFVYRLRTSQGYTPAAQPGTGLA